MGKGYWRRALCTTTDGAGDGDGDGALVPPAAAMSSPSPRSCGKLQGFFSNPAGPKLRCRTKVPDSGAGEAPRTPAPPGKKGPGVPLLQALSAPSSPRSPSRLAMLLKASFLPSSKSRCGVCSQSTKSGGGVFTAECGHLFHMACIASRVSGTGAGGALACPVCTAPWSQAPFLASLRLHCMSQPRPAASSPAPANKTPTATPRTKKAAGNKLDAAEKTTPTPAGKMYDDDEPLLRSPKAGGGGFIPIPEADEVDGDEDADEVNDFRGFFPKSGGGGAGIVVTMSPEAALVSSGRRHGKYVVAIRVKAPPLRSPSSLARAPVDLVTVLDVSQRMNSEKLQMLKRGMRMVIASLDADDRLAIVAFSGAAKRLLPLRRMSRQGQRSARQIVDRLVICAAAQGGGDRRRSRRRTDALLLPSSGTIL